eukprot:6289885-Alexandrium_andersonii.AAC.1
MAASAVPPARAVEKSANSAMAFFSKPPAPWWGQRGSGAKRRNTNAPGRGAARQWCEAAL